MSFGCHVEQVHDGLAEPCQDYVVLRKVGRVQKTWYHLKAVSLNGQLEQLLLVFFWETSGDPSKLLSYQSQHSFWKKEWPTRGAFPYHKVPCKLIHANNLLGKIDPGEKCTKWIKSVCFWAIAIMLVPSGASLLNSSPRCCAKKANMSWFPDDCK